MDTEKRLNDLIQKLMLLEKEVLRYKRNCDIMTGLQADMTEMSELWKQYIQNTPLLATLAPLLGRDVKLT